MRQQNYYNLKTEYSNKNYNIDDTTLDWFNMIIFSMDILFFISICDQKQNLWPIRQPTDKIKSSSSTLINDTASRNKQTVCAKAHFESNHSKVS